MTGPETLVTGATGFVGGLVLRELLAADRPTRVLVRRPQSGAALLAAVRQVAGSLEDPGSLVRAVEGCEVVFHVAGLNAMCLPDPSSFYRVNVEGTRNLLDAARRAGVRRVVLTSSAATCLVSDGGVADEAAPRPASFYSHYARSKFEAEQLALGFAGIEVVAVNPSSVQGPGRTTGTAKLFLDFLNGKLPFDLSAEFGLCYTDDCAAGHLAAERHGAPGQRYLLNSGTLTGAAALDLIGEIAGITERPRTLPIAAAMAAGTVMEAMARIRKRRPSLCREAVRTLSHPHRYDGSRAERELGVSYTPLRTALERTVRWYVNQGLVTRSLPRLATGTA